MSVLLDAVRSFSSKTLRQHTLSALLALSGINSLFLTLQLSSNPDKTTGNVDFVKHLDTLVATLGVGPEGCGRVFASFLPGISMAITQLVTSDTNLCSPVTVLSHLTWAHYVSVVMKDSECGWLKSEERKALSMKGSNCDKASEDDPGVKQLTVERSLSWQQETDAKLCVLVQRMCGLVTSSNWRVRMGLVSWTHILLSHSYRYTEYITIAYFLRLCT